MTMDLNATIDEIVRRQFATEQIESVSIEEDTNFDGEDILRVTVVFKSKGLDPVKAKGLVRHMRSTLTTDGRFTFPVVAFRSLADQKRIAAAAA